MILANLKEIAAFIKQYDEKSDRYDVKRCLADIQFFESDLLRLLSLWSPDTWQTPFRVNLGLACFTLIVKLTWPIWIDNNAKHNHVQHRSALIKAQDRYRRVLVLLALLYSLYLKKIIVYNYI